MPNKHNEIQTQHGRYHLFPSQDKFIIADGTFILYLENCHHDNDFWLHLTHEHENPKGYIGSLKFRKIAPSKFVLDDIRPALCPMLNQPALCKEPSGCQQGRS